MVNKITELVDYYARYIKLLSAEDETIETFGLIVLTIRDELEKRWEELSKQQREQVLTGDDRICRKHRKIARVLPSPHAHPRSHWWWFLHEGPQVRSQALAATNETA